MFLHAALAKCGRCLAFWLHRGADLSRGAASHADSIALQWARASNASPEIMGLSLQYGLRPRAFCAGVELDMYVRSAGKTHRREVSQMSPRSQDHDLCLRAAGSLCKVCVLQGGMVPVREATFLLFLSSRGGGSAWGCFSLFRLLVIWGR